MLTVFNHEETGIEVVSNEETNHVGVSNNETFKGMSYAVIWFLKRLITIYIIIFRRLFRQVEVLQPIMNWMWTETLHYYENRIFPLDEEYVLIMCRDISERVATQQNLEIFKRILDRVSDSILAVSADGTLVYANRQFIEEYGVKEELGTQKVYDLPVSLNTKEHI